MYWLQKSYVNQISSSLRNFKWKGTETANFSCPVCGDSTKDSRKARGYLHTVNDKKTFERVFMFTCHNGCASMSFDAFLKHVNQNLHDDYRMEVYKERSQGSTKTIQTPEPIKHTAPVIQKVSTALVPCSELPEDHEAVQYLHKRQIPDLSKFYWAKNFVEAIESLNPENVIKVKPEPRVCLIMRDQIGNPTGIIGRQIDKNADPKFRYMTVKFDEDFPKIYGLENLNRTRTHFLVEGPIDSIYIPNAVALCGGFMSLDTLESLVDKDKTIVALDNEPRKKEVVEHMQKFAVAGYKIVVWRDMPSELKDISDMVCKGGFSVRDLLTYIASHTFSGLQAQQELNIWKRINVEDKNKQRVN